MVCRENKSEFMLLLGLWNELCCGTVVLVTESLTLPRDRERGFEGGPANSGPGLAGAAVAVGTFTGWKKSASSVGAVLGAKGDEVYGSFGSSEKTDSNGTGVACTCDGATLELMDDLTFEGGDSTGASSIGADVGIGIESSEKLAASNELAVIDNAETLEPEDLLDGRCLEGGGGGSDRSLGGGGGGCSLGRGGGGSSGGGPEVAGTGDSEKFDSNKTADKGVSVVAKFDPKSLLPTNVVPDALAVDVVILLNGSSVDGVTVAVLAEFAVNRSDSAVGKVGGAIWVEPVMIGLPKGSSNTANCDG